ncbi:MAG TPA: amidase, partial [Candidatus Saccharimonadales bacterium]|nr:amidase [Candidatus Saccharimonadales bacterium]
LDRCQTLDCVRTELWRAPSQKSRLKLDRYRTRTAELARLNVFICLTDEEGDGEVVAVKDLVDVKGTRTTGGGVILPREAKARDAPLISAIREHGCLVIGKTNLHEWAYGLTNINPHYGTVRNPRDETRIAGGSSGGSAAAVAAELCDWAIGTDTGGSVRVPAALCGVVGFKPTYGSIEMTGVQPLSDSLDTVGTLARDVTTATHGAAMMAHQPSWVPNDVPPIAQIRLAVPRGWVYDLDDAVGAVWSRIQSQVPEVSFPPLGQLTDSALDILSVEAAALHSHWVASVPELYGPDVLKRLTRALTVNPADRVAALDRRAETQIALAQAMADFDAILLPTAASVAPAIGPQVDIEPLTRFTRAFNYTGQPVYTMPAPTAGLPVGIQVVGRLGQEAALARVALALERSWAAGALEG